jgi:hypothetical protein
MRGQYKSNFGHLFFNFMPLKQDFQLFLDQGSLKINLFREPVEKRQPAAR